MLDLLYEIAKGFKKEEIGGGEEGAMAEAHTDPEAQMKIFSMDGNLLHETLYQQNVEGVHNLKSCRELFV